MTTVFCGIVCLLILFCALFLFFSGRCFFSFGRFNCWFFNCWSFFNSRWFLKFWFLNRGSILNSRCFFNFWCFNRGRFLSFRRFNRRRFLSNRSFLNSRSFFSNGSFLNSRSFFSNGIFLNSRSIGSFLLGFLLRQHFSSRLVHLFLCIETTLCFGTLFLFIFLLEGVGRLLFVVLPGFETSFRFCLIKCTLGYTSQQVFLHQHPFVGKDVAYGVSGLCPCLQPIQSSVEV